MDIEATIETIASYLPEELDIGNVVRTAADLVPTDLELGHIAKFLLIFAVGSLILSILGRFILGRRSSLNHSLSSVMAILFVYAATVIVYTFKPWSLEQLLSPLPFVTFFNDYMVVMPVVGIYPTVLARELLRLIILAFLVNLLDTFVPQGKTALGWFCLRFLTVALAMVLHLVIHWAFDTYLPDVLVTYAPMILLAILGGTMLLGVLNFLLGVLLAVVDPILGAIYTFFFANIIGKQLTKAVLTTLIICVVIFLLGHFGYTLICVTEDALLSYVPIGIAMLVLWYIIGHLL